MQHNYMMQLIFTEPPATENSDDLIPYNRSAGRLLREHPLECLVLS